MMLLQSSTITFNHIINIVFSILITITNLFILHVFNINFVRKLNRNISHTLGLYALKIHLIKRILRQLVILM